MARCSGPPCDLPSAGVRGCRGCVSGRGVAPAFRARIGFGKHRDGPHSLSRLRAPGRPRQAFRGVRHIFEYSTVSGGRRRTGREVFRDEQRRSPAVSTTPPHALAVFLRQPLVGSGSGSSREAPVNTRSSRRYWARNVDRGSRPTAGNATSAPGVIARPVYCSENAVIALSNKEATAAGLAAVVDRASGLANAPADSSPNPPLQGRPPIYERMGRPL